jgi:hypothetical protein
VEGLKSSVTIISPTDVFKPSRTNKDTKESSCYNKQKKSVGKVASSNSRHQRGLLSPTMAGCLES